ncbi:hypothetical protein ACFVUW_11695 [Streptomyces xiamenensis]|uniref:hypothetical protein n=1 Tax=Streptomyces xiamenensis TaxID=408015 RepID=UPI0036E904C0
MTDVPTAIALYEPRSLDPGTWAQIAAFARKAVEDFGPVSPWAAVQHLSVVTRISAWALEQGLPLDVEVLFTPERIEHFIAVGLTGLADSSRRTHRSQLAAVGRAVTRRAPWPPAAPPLSRNRLAPPYTETEVAGFLQIARKQSTPGRTSIAWGLLAAGLGAGLYPGEHLTITGSAITSRHQVTVLTVSGRRPREVPVLAAYAPLLHSLAARFPDEPLIGATSATDKNRLNRLTGRIDVPIWLPPLISPRLRTTWLVTLLSARVPLPEILEAAGLASTSSLIDLVPHLTRQPPARAARTIAQALTDPPRAPQ